MRLAVSFHGLFWLALCLSSCHSPDILSTKENFVINCDAEQVSGRHFSNNGVLFSHGDRQSDEAFFSGRHSIKLSPDKPFGFGCEMGPVFSGDTISASVWRYARTGFGALAIQGDHHLYMDQAEFSETKGKWTLLNMQMVIPPGFDSTGIKVFAYNTGKEGDVYFDDLKVSYRKNSWPPRAIRTVEYPTLKIDIPDSSYHQLLAKRSEAYAKGYLDVGRKDFLPAQLTVDDRQLAVKIRLKGDLLDHLSTKKWSFRILLPGSGEWHHMQEFSIQKPQTRNMLHEWVLHRLLAEEEIFTTYYGFCRAILNGESLGIYAIEEAFNNSIFKSRGLDPMPIVRFNENGLWVNASKSSDQVLPFFASADIKGFKRQQGIDQEMQQRAKQQLFRFKKGSGEVEELFDIDQMARMLALIDLANGWHALQWKNVRFCMDPETNKLLPIVFDAYNKKEVDRSLAPFAGYEAHHACDLLIAGEKCLIPRLFSSQNLYDKYLGYLYDFTRQDYIDKLLYRLYPETRSLERFLQTEFPNYRYDFLYLKSNARNILKYLMPYPMVSLKAYRSGDTLYMESYHPVPLVVIGLGNKKKMRETLADPIRLASYRKGHEAPNIRWPTRAGGRYVYFKIPGIDQLFQEKIIPHPYPGL